MDEVVRLPVSRAAPDSLAQMFEQAPGFMSLLSGPDHVFELANAAYRQLLGHRDMIGRPVREAVPEAEGQGFFELLDRVYATGEPFVGRSVPISLQPRPGAPSEERILDFIYQPITDEAGATTGIFVEGSDVTDQARQDVALRASEERYRQIVEGAEDFAIVALDDHGIITAWNSGAERIMGWPAAEAIGQPTGFFFTPEDNAAGVPDHEMNRAATAGRAVNERWHPRRDGGRFWGSGLLMRTEGAPGGYLKMFRDRTAEHEAEAALRDSEERLRALNADLERQVADRTRERTITWEVSPDLLGALDPDGYFRTSNPAWLTLLGWTEAEVARQSIWELLHPDDLERTREGFQLTQVGQPAIRFPNRYRHKDGTYRWISWVGIPVDGMVYCTGRDITAEKIQAEALSAATAERNLLATIVETTDVMVMACALDYTILAVNKANADEFERVYGTRPKAGDNILALLEGHPEHQEQVRAGWGRGLAGEEVTFVEDFGDPATVRPYYEVKFRALRDAAGTRVGAYQFVTDVTERLRAQAQLAETQEALRQSQKMEAMGSLTGGVAHDFNNLLAPIIGALDRLVTREVGSERERRLIAGALQSAERAKVLVQRLLAFSRRQPLQPVAVDLSSLVRGMAGLIGSTLGPRIDLRVEVEGDLPPARADANQVEMALLNLAVNARDAMPDGGRLTIAATSESVWAPHPAGLRRGPYVRLAVTDTGTGMDEATLARAVEPFFSTKGIGRGTGLGLSMVHGLAAQLGGGLTIDSAPGRGTTVVLWLPISGVPVDEPEAARATCDPVASRGRALLVDDEDLVRMSTADMLMDLGFEVLEAVSAEEALGLLREGAAIDLLVTDHLMPGLSGVDLAREARLSSPGLPVLVVSGYAEAEGVAPDLPRLVKPFRAAELAERVAALMSGAGPVG